MDNLDVHKLVTDGLLTGLKANRHLSWGTTWDGGGRDASGSIEVHDALTGDVFYVTVKRGPVFAPRTVAAP